MEKVCKDCVSEGIGTSRPALYPGPRCFTHWNAEKKRRKLKKAESQVSKNFDLSPEQYNAIYEIQDGRCPICRHARGITKRLAVDHDHKVCAGEHPSDKGCAKCIRGLLCVSCNYSLLGRYDIEALERAIQYLRNPPARAVLNP